MQLSERICNLRREANMSQGDLAEKMNVSRQSVSKRETGASVPDLDKLIALSQIFGVTIDSLVRKNAAVNREFAERNQNEASGSSCEPSAQNIGSLQKIIGAILLAVGLLTFVLGLVFGLILLIFAAYFILCGVLCLVVRKHVGLIIGWLTLLPFLSFSRPLTGINLSAIFAPYLYENSMYIQLCIGYALWIFTSIMVFASVRKTRFQGLAPIILGWLAIWNMRGIIPTAFGFMAYNGIIYPIMAWLAIGLILVLSFFTARFVISLARKNKAE